MSADCEAPGLTGGFCTANTARAATPAIELGERLLVLNDVEQVARGAAAIFVAADVLRRIAVARESVMRLANSGDAIYGLNTALGANTGKRLAGHDELMHSASAPHSASTPHSASHAASHAASAPHSAPAPHSASAQHSASTPHSPAALSSPSPGPSPSLSPLSSPRTAATFSGDILSEYQINAVRARNVAVGAPLATDVVRAALFARVAGMRMGGSGISPAVFEALVAMLNNSVHPVVPKYGSISVADLAPLSALASPLIGEGVAEFGGAIMPGADAMAAAGIARPVLGPKDGLALISSNAATIGAAAIMLIDVRDALSSLEHAAALASEGFRANTGPLDSRMQAARPAPGQTEAARRMSALLEHSALWRPGNARRVQDPLSFRCIAQVHGAAIAAWNECRAQVELELNSAADSPLVLESGEILSNGNFHIPALAIALESLGLGLAQCAAMSVERSIKLLSPATSGLPLHLTLHGPAHSGFATVQKTLTALYAKIRHLANPCCLDYLPVSEGIEDHATMAMNVVDKTVAMIEPLCYIAAIETLIGAQAVDLRGPALGVAALGRGPARLHSALRRCVPMLDHDRALGPDIESAAVVLREIVVEKSRKDGTGSSPKDGVGTARKDGAAASPGGGAAMSRAAGTQTPCEDVAAASHTGVDRTQ